MSFTSLIYLKLNFDLLFTKAASCVYPYFPMCATSTTCVSSKFQFAKYYISKEINILINKFNRGESNI